MAEAIATTKRYAVVTGSNKGIGFEICRQLASKGIIVVLTARDEKKGFEALEKLKSDGLSDHVVFCQLDVVDPSSVASLADFIKSKFGRLDILVNNAGILGDKMDWDSLQSSEASVLIPSEWAKGVLNDVESLTEERVEEVLNEFLKDFKEGALETKGWPTFWSAYTVSKAVINAYTRILAKKYPTFCINCVCPGWVKIDMNNNLGKKTIEQGAQCPVKLALLPDDGPSGLFFINNELASFV
ncbi:(+)-neomenthol dehydrogenase-like isoform X2 [Camellia sinensis]|uniref:(+)-neomenthol dehydrogenase-like isoform X2 n=2 Tax=Camellia sinensis TaxID=4442 RepID=UPI001036333C|nr:(+)-neomenthol dehydrogenase-like isoform X2 [Camellia sinensis]